MLHLPIAAVTAAALLTPAAPALYACQVKYEMVQDWQAFQSNITITNTGEELLKTWTLKFTLPAGQRLTSGWNADWTEEAGAATAVSKLWNSKVAKGESAHPVFRGTGTDLTSEPVSFTVNGIACSVI